MASLTRTGTAAAAFLLAAGLATTSFAQVIVGPGYPYPYRYRYAAPDASVKFDVKPKDAAVYVDGYYAGLVDDYDGVFQRLRTTPGGHEITLFLDGYRTYSERVYLSADNTIKFKHRMEKLAAGETSQRPPAPQPPPQYQPGDQGDQGGPGPVTRAPGRRGRPFPPNGPDNGFPPPPPPGNQERRDADNNGRGTLSLSVQPRDADVLVDGTPWRNDAGGEHLTIDLSEGRHNVQIRKPGYIGYLTDVQIRRGETATLDVQLKTQPQ